ncbi:MAG TPA: universal stress protein [Pyrinomonadaceae bacterium]|nr:universal stress protein [Pyrinomonadaceae bacterium]
MEVAKTNIESVLHPTDFSESSLVAFHHALKIALLTKSNFTLFNVSPDGGPEWANFPGVRESLERWGLLPANSPRSAVGELGVHVRKIVAEMNDPVKAVLGYLERHPVDLIVLATRQRDGSVRWLGKSVSEPIARTAWQMTLFIPGGASGFVSAEDGSVQLNKILIPVAHSPLAEPAVEAAARLVQRLSCPAGTFTLMHVGSADSMPAVRCPEVPGWNWKKETRTGDVIQGIVAAARDTGADLIVMSTDGRNEFLDSLRGSHSERVLRHGAASLLTVPVGALAATDPHE